MVIYSEHFGTIDVPDQIPIGWLIEGLGCCPFLEQVMMIDGKQNPPLYHYLYQKDIIGLNMQMPGTWTLSCICRTSHFSGSLIMLKIAWKQAKIMMNHGILVVFSHIGSLNNCGSLHFFLAEGFVCRAALSWSEIVYLQRSKLRIWLWLNEVWLVVVDIHLFS